MDILEKVAIEFPCKACGGRYEVTLKQVLLSQEMLHEGCPVQIVDECPPLVYSGLADQEIIQELKEFGCVSKKRRVGTVENSDCDQGKSPACPGNSND